MSIIKSNTTVPVCVPSLNYVDREELDGAVSDLRAEIEAGGRFTTDEIDRLLGSLEKLVAPKRMLAVATEVDNTTMVSLDIDAEDLLSMIQYSQADALWNFVVSNWDTDAFIEEVKDSGEWPKNFIPAIDFNNAYDFKRYVCDMLEVGYHTDDWALVKSIACYINPDFKVL